MNSLQTRTSKKKILLIATCALFVLGAGITAFLLTRDSSPVSSTEESGAANSTSEPQSTDTKTSEDVNNSANTADDTKANAIDKPQTPNKANVTVTVVDASQYGDMVEVRAYASDVSSSATCTFTFTKGSASVVRQTKASPSAQTTSCATLAIPASDFAPTGAWNLVVSYNTASSNGSSDKQTIEIK